jgi:glycine/sarcosine N-methyltransferase
MMSEIQTSSLKTTETPPGVPSQDFAGQYVPTFVDRWDDLIDWSRRKAGEEGFFVETLQSSGARQVLDVAAGTGFHSVALAEAGFEVTAADGSAEMLKRAADNARERGHTFPTVHTDWRELGSKLDVRFDAIVCLGSSFPHLFEVADRRKALSEFFAALKPGGVLIIDHRNFDAIREHRYSSSGNYYYCGTNVSVSVEHIDETLCRFRYEFPDQATYRLEVYPILKDELVGLLEQAGFDSIRTFGDFKSEVDTAESDFIIHVARKS